MYHRSGSVNSSTHASPEPTAKPATFFPLPRRAQGAFVIRTPMNFHPNEERRMAEAGGEGEADNSRTPRTALRVVCKSQRATPQHARAPSCCCCKCSALVPLHCARARAPLLISKHFLVTLKKRFFTAKRSEPSNLKSERLRPARTATFSILRLTNI